MDLIVYPAQLILQLPLLVLKILDLVVFHSRAVPYQAMLIDLGAHSPCVSVAGTQLRRMCLSWQKILMSYDWNNSQLVDIVIGQWAYFVAGCQ